MIEGVSGSGKTTVCDALIRRGFHAVHGDRVLRPSANPLDALESTEHDPAGRAARVHGNATWDSAKLRPHLENRDAEVTFFCGGFRNHAELLPLFDGVFVLAVDTETLEQRLARRPTGEFGSLEAEKALILRLHATQEDMPEGAVHIDAARPIEEVAQEIVFRVGCAWDS